MSESKVRALFEAWGAGNLPPTFFLVELEPTGQSWLAEFRGPGRVIGVVLCPCKEVNGASEIRKVYEA